MFQAFDFTVAVDEPSPGEAGAFGGAQAIPREDLALLCETGLLALAAQRGLGAKPIFAYLDAAQPDNAAGAIGLAMIEAAQGREREAFARLRRAVAEKRRCVAEAKAVLCVLLMEYGRASEARALRRDLLRGPDCGARRLVQAQADV